MKTPDPAAAPTVGWGGDGSSPVEGVVHFAGVATPYLRCGEGPALIVLMDPAEGFPGDDPLLRRLARGFLVIAPIFPAGPSNSFPPAPAWIAGLAEGLGLEAPAVLYRTLPPESPTFGAPPTTLD